MAENLRVERVGKGAFAMLVGLVVVRVGRFYRSGLWLLWGLLLIACSSAWAEEPDGELRVDLRGAIPDMLRLQRVAVDGWLQVDSAWQQADGLYHFALPSSGGLYQLVHASHSEPIPLYLDGRGGVLLRSWGGSMLDSCRVLYGAEDTRAYLAVVQAATRYRRVLNHLDALAALRVGTAVCDIGGIRGMLVDSLRELVSQWAPRLSPAMAGLCRIMLPCSDSLVSSWWPRGVLDGSQWVGSPDVLRRLDDYILSHRQLGLTKSQQDSAYWAAIVALGNAPMGREMAEWLRLQLVYNFSGTDYDALADSLTECGFGQLKGSGRQFSGGGGFNLRGVRVRTVDGGKVDIVDARVPRTLVVFWSVWCGHCQALLPSLWAWWQRRGRGKVSVRAVSVDVWSDELRAHIRTRGWGWVNAVDGDGSGRRLADALGVESTPEFYLLDSLGDVVGRPSSIEQLEAELGR